MGHAIPKEEALDELIKAVGLIGRAERSMSARQAAIDEFIADLKASEADEITRDEADVQAGWEAAIDIVQQHWPELISGQNTKTLVLSSGTVQVRSTPSSLEVTDEPAALRWLRRNGLLRRFTRVGKRTIDKRALKEAPDVVERMNGARINDHDNLVIKPATTQVESKRPISRISRPLT